MKPQSYIFNQSQELISSPEKKTKILLQIQSGNIHEVYEALWIAATAAKLKPSFWNHEGALWIRILQEGLSDGIKRNAAYILAHDYWPSDLHGNLLQVAMITFGNPEESIATRVYCMQICARLAHIYPEILPEINHILDLHLPHASPAFKAKARQLFKRFD